MATITGKLESVAGAAAEAGSVEIALCGYGSFLPRGADQCLIARPTTQPQDIPVDGSGAFSVTLLGNDQIEPAGTYYTVTIKDANGDIVQCSAYLFLGSASYDLNDTDPFDPSQQPPTIPPAIINQLQIVPAADAMVFDGSAYTAFRTTLGADVTQPVFENMVPGNLYTFIVLQDGTGGWDFRWAGNVLNAAPVCSIAGSTTVQTFVADEFGNLIAISAGTYL